MNAVPELTHRLAHRLWIVAACLLVLAGTAFADGETPAGPEGQTPTEQAEAEAAGEEKTEPDTINLNLKGANIEQIMDFVGKTTGKVVVQGKDIKGSITVASPEPVTKERAIELIYHALRMQGISVIERDGIISLVQTKDLPKVGVQDVAPDDAMPIGGFVRKMVRVQFADVEHVQKLIEPLLGEGGKVQADPLSRQLIVTVAAADLANLERLIGEVDVLEMAESQVGIFQLEHAEASEIAEVLQAILEGGAGGGKKPSPAGKPSGGPGDGITVVAYPTVNWILVRAPKEKLQAAEKLIGELDREKPPEVTLFVLPLMHSDAGELARQLSEVFKRRRTTRGIRDTVEITADTRSNSLLVYATPENAELVRGVVKEVDTEESRQTETRLRALEFADAEDLATQLTSLYSSSSQSYYPWYYSSRQQQGGKTRFIAEPHSNSLIIVAQPAQFDEIEELIKQLDQPLNDAEISPRIYRIRNVDAEDMTEVLNEVFGGEREEGRGGYWDYYYGYGRTQESTVGRLYGKTRFVHEGSTNSVIVITNNAKNFNVIKAVIDDLDRAMPEAANTMVCSLDHADAEQVAEQLNRLFARPGAGEGGETEEDARAAYYGWLMGSSKDEERPISNLIGKVRVIGDSRTNSLIVTTAVQNFDAVRAIIKELDKETPKVLIRVHLVEITRTDESRIGTRWGGSSSIFDSKDFNSGLLGSFGYSWEDVSGNTVLTAGVDVSALVQFLQRDFDASVLSQPALVVNNNEEAHLFVGSEIPYIKESTGEPGTIATKNSYDYKNVGLKLDIKPHINDQGRVVTSIVLESSQQREGEVLLGAAIIDTRQYNTHLAVESGQTIVIGGILSTEETEIIHRVPILGHIPVVKLLFSKRDTMLITRELIAFVTPTVLKNRQEEDAATARERMGASNADALLNDLDALQ